MTEYRVTIQHGEESHDLSIGSAPSSTVRELVAALDAQGYRGPFSLGPSTLTSDGPLRRAGIRHGSHLTSRGTRCRFAEPTPGRYLVVVAGPCSGTYAKLAEPGVALIGRDSGILDLSSDSRVSKQHLEVELTEAGAFITDLESANGTQLNDHPLTGKSPLSPGDYVVIGDSVLELVSVDVADIAVLPEADGPTTVFQRRFRIARDAVPSEVRLPTPPPTSSSAGYSWWRSLIPLVAGLGIAVVTGRLIYLALIAIAPLIYAVDAWRQQNGQRRQANEKQRQYDVALHTANELVANRRLLELQRRRDDGPAPGVGLLWASLLHRRLWERRPQDADFGTVCLGVGRARSAVAFVADGTTTAELVPIGPVPLHVSLVTNGALAIIGPLSRGRGTLRSMLMDLATSHSPSDVSLWLFGNDHARTHFGFLRWLPHAWSADGPARIAVTEETRASRLSELRAIYEARTELTDTRTVPLPLHVVIIDGSLLFRPGQLAELLERGPAIGIISVIVDSELIPDGVSASLTFEPETWIARFQSRVTAMGLVHVSELSEPVADQAARRLASLRSAAGEQTTLAGESERLVDIIGREGLLPVQVLRSWQLRGPVTKVPVGSTAKSRVDLDIARDGPHGLVGGMTRSGKTEFLKTLICSLAMRNHPDDLCFVIVDFKGGVDYEFIRRLPHVLEVTSNADLDQFERTIRLLEAERRRREDLFRSAGVPNLNAYREKRRNSPSLSPIPRLIVLVDEFGELSNNDIGRAHLKSLESLSRVGGGHGMNLLLVTQKFDGQLPDQIDSQAGMRVCFRVLDPKDSRMLLKTTVAALPASAKGRGYIVTAGSEPVEFQSARVAGRREDLELNEASELTILRESFDTLGQSRQSAEQPDVPSEESDMATLLDVMKEATSLSGWDAPAVPWPMPLSDHIPLEDAWAMRENAGGVPLGVVDLPDEQRRGVWTFGAEDSHLLLMGGGLADLRGVLITLAASAALSCSPDDLHLYAVDFTGRGLGAVQNLPHCGAVAVNNDAIAARLVSHLLDEMARRRAALVEYGLASLDELDGVVGGLFPNIFLFVLGADRMYPTQGSGGGAGHHPLLAPLSQLVSGSGGLRLQIVLAGQPVIATRQPGALIDRRLGLTTPQPTDYLVPGMPRSLLSDLRGPRRALDLNTHRSVQLCHLGPEGVGESSSMDALADLLSPVSGRGQVPKRFAEVSWPLPMAALIRSRPAGQRSVVPLGLSNETGDPIVLDAEEDVNWFVTGGAKSGKSNTLVSLGMAALANRWSVVAVAFSPKSPLRLSQISCVAADECGSAIEDAVGPVLLLVDDLHRCPPDGTSLIKSRRPELAVMSATRELFANGYAARHPFEPIGLGFPRHGVVLAPRGNLSPLPRQESVRADVVGSARPGKGVFFLHGEATEVTVPLVIEVDRMPPN